MSNNKANMSGTEIIAEAVKTPKVYEFRKLGATDVFPMLKIIKEIGVNKFADCFQKPSIKQAIAKGTTNIDQVAGIAVFTELAQVVIEGLDKCEEDVYKLLSRTSNLKVDEIKALDMATFVEMIVDFIKKDDFKDFFKAVSKLLHKAT